MLSAPYRLLNSSRGILIFYQYVQAAPVKGFYFCPHYAELYEIINGVKYGRETEKEITLYDSVGIALEDYSALTLTYDLLEQYGLGINLELTPTMNDPKNLISALN